MANRPGSMERERYILGPDQHYGLHTGFGRHFAVGRGAQTVHLYPGRIHIGGSSGDSLPLNSRQSAIVTKVLDRIARRIEEQKMAKRLAGVDNTARE